MQRRGIVLPACLLLGLAVLAARWATELDPSPASVAPRPVTTASPAPSLSASQYVWKVSLDPRGRPYDVEVARGVTIERRPLATLHAPSRGVLFMGGEYLPYGERSEGQLVLLAKRKGRTYPVQAIWERSPGGIRGIVGVVVVERDAPVARWKELHPVAYGTDAGTGGITTVEWADRSKTEKEALQRPLVVWQGQSASFDVDGHPGIDTIGFSNGFGDGGFPSVAGYDKDGNRVQIVLWTIVVPWRLAFPVGKPPAQVTQRENAFAACIAGKRLIEGSRCRVVR